MSSRLQYGWIPDENSRLFMSRGRFEVQRYNRLSDGELESMEVSPGWFLTSKQGLGTFFELKFQKEGVEELFSLSDEVEILAGEYNFIGFRGFIFTPQSKSISSRFGFETGQFYDGSIISLEASPTLNLNSTIQISGSYEYNIVNFPERNQYLRSHIARANLLFMFSNKFSASTFIQFNNANETFIGNFRLRYNPREGNDFYLVYNEYRGFLIPESNLENPPYYNRAVLLKYTHTLRL
jgi:hypothetical protein